MFLCLKWQSYQAPFHLRRDVLLSRDNSLSGIRWNHSAFARSLSYKVLPIVAEGLARKPTSSFWSVMQGWKVANTQAKSTRVRRLWLSPIPGPLELRPYGSRTKAPQTKTPGNNPQTKTPWTKTPLDKNPPCQKPPGQKPPDKTFFSEIL